MLFVLCGVSHTAALSWIIQGGLVIDGVIYLLVFSSGVFLLAVTSGVESPH